MKVFRYRMLLAICLVMISLVIVENIAVFLINEHRYGNGYSQREAVFMNEAIEKQITHTVTEERVSLSSFSRTKGASNISLRIRHVSNVENRSNSESEIEKEVLQEENVFRDMTEDGNNVSHSITETYNSSPEMNEALSTDKYAPVVLEGKQLKFDVDSDESWSSRTKPTPLPPHIASLFPTNMSNTTLLFPPPLNSSFHFKRFHDVFTNKNINIFELLARWENLSQPFYNKQSPRFRFPPSYTDSPPPVPRECRITPGPHFRKTHKSYRWIKYAECYEQGVKQLTPFEQDGNHILFTIRTSASLHSSRLPLIFQTWLSAVNRSNVVIVTDQVDHILQYRALEAGINYLVSVPGYERLCEKAGDETSLMFLPENQHYEWFCHVDDDMYVNLDRLVTILAIFKRDDPIYFGRSGTSPGEPRRVLREAKVGSRGTPYNFAVGGMYCLNRALLDRSRRWIGGRESFRRMCSLTKEPEDVTVGFVVGILLGLELNQTGLIHSHGNDLYGVNPATLKHQIGISYGFGKVHWGYRSNNVITVPHNLFTLAEDPSQFLSLHCHYHRHVGWCVNKERSLMKQKYLRYQTKPWDKPT